MRSKVKCAPASIKRRAGVWAQYPKTVIPAATPAVTPVEVSSMTAHAAGGTPDLSAAYRFAPGNFRDAEQLVLELGQQARLPQGDLHLFVAAVRRNTVRRAQPVQRRFDSRDRLEFRVQRPGDAPVIVLDEVLRHLVSQQSCDDLETLRHGLTDKLLERLRRGDRDSQLIEHLREHAAGNQFAVDQNTVAIKDHQGKSPVRHVAAAEKERVYCRT